MARAKEPRVRHESDGVIARDFGDGGGVNNVDDRAALWGDVGAGEYTGQVFTDTRGNRVLHCDISSGGSANQCAKRIRRVHEQRHDRRAAFQRPVTQATEHALDEMRKLCNGRQAETTGNPFDRVRGPEDRMHELRVRIATLEREQARFDDGEMIGRFLEEERAEMIDVVGDTSPERLAHDLRDDFAQHVRIERLHQPSGCARGPSFFFHTCI